MENVWRSGGDVQKSVPTSHHSHRDRTQVDRFDSSSFTAELSHGCLSVFSEEFLDPKANAIRNQRLLRAWWHHWPCLPDCSGESQASLQTQRGNPGEHLFGNWEDVPVAPTHLLRAEGCDGNKSENHLSTWEHCLQPAQLQAAHVLWLMESLQTFRELSRRVLKSTCSFKIALARKFLVLPFRCFLGSWVCTASSQFTMAQQTLLWDLGILNAFFVLRSFQSQPWLHSEFEIHLDYIGPCLKKKTNSKPGLMAYPSKHSGGRCRQICEFQPARDHKI